MKEQSIISRKTDLRTFPKREWNLPDTKKLRLRYNYGNSVVAEFVSGHDYVDALRELVQNEYDAGGSKLSIAFGTDALHISGNGHPIDAGGWKRLSVMLGTGRVDGSGATIERKVNGIGSKNFGLRSLFLYGDQIYIRSGGLQTVLDYFSGTLPHPEPEPLSKGLPGIEIVVPYRTRKSKELGLFDTAQEKQALDSFVTDLTSTVMKLAQPQAPKSLCQVEISSIRCSRLLVLKQSVKIISRQKGITVIQRTIQLTDSDASSSQESKRRIEEIEFQKIISLPPQYREQIIPGYYKVPGGRLRLAISLRKNGKKIAIQHPGHLFYPLAAPNAYTGNAISVNAPFQMNADRSEIANPGTNAFNKWLLNNAIDLTFELLVSDWWKDFGPEGYLALQEQTPLGNAFFSKKVLSRLENDACWPTRAREEGSSKRPQLAKATNIVIPTHPTLDGYLSDSRYLDDMLGNDPRIQDMVKKCGAGAFGINSLVRFRCTGKDNTKLATQLAGGEASWAYTNFPDALKKESLQQQFARTFDTLASRLSRQNREDLKKSPTTLAADGSLQAPERLWIVNPTIASVCPLLVSERLHPALMGCKTLVGLCNKYDAKEWIQKTAQQVQDGTASEEQRTALYQFVLGSHGRLDRATWAMVRKTPVLRDHRNKWVTPDAITLRRVPGASKLEAALHFPHPDYENDKKLAEALRFRKKVTGEDLVGYARIVATDPEVALEFEETLQRFRQLLTRQELEKLKTIAFLRSSRGKLAAPSTLYLRTTHNLACLGDGALFAAGSRITLYKYLGCLEQPKAEDIIAFLSNLHRQGIKPPQPEVLYSALVEALKVKKTLPTFYKDQPIIWNGRGYSRPIDMLLNRKYRKIFLQAVPCFEEEGSPVLQQAFKLLGVPSDPQPQHWQRLFLWFGQRYGQPGRSLSQFEQNALLNAYSHLGDIPGGVTDDTKCLLDRNGRLHSRAEMGAKQFLLDDDPDLAQALVRNGPLPAFANVNGSQQARLIQFYKKIGVSFLTEVCEEVGFDVGEEIKAPAWCDPNRVIEKLHNRSFLSALTTLADYQLQEFLASSNPPLPKLEAVRSLVFVQSLQIKYRVGSITLPVSTYAILDGERFVVVEAQGPNELDEMLSLAIASLFVKLPVEQRRFANAVYRALTCTSVSEIANYLRRQGIPWEPPSFLSKPESIHSVDEINHLVMDSQAGYQLEDGTFNGQAHKDSQFVQEVIKSSITNLLSVSHTTSHTALGSDTTEKENNSIEISSNALTLPPIASVLPVSLKPSGSWAPQEARANGSERKRLRTPSVSVDEERNKELGQRGEEIIFRQEIERVKRLGYPISRVVWIAKENPLADYDILSVDENGRDLWLEVKSTVGQHGHFQWSVAELEKAIQERGQYILWRVYEVNTIHPGVKAFRDPVGMIIQHSIKLDIASLSAEIEPLRCV
ncbi:MAG TPA: DUF3883 domain-containing protein [Ktedonobacteraceae bacterium]|nr:DUF3883 domain-containing protein [Ktedonobacteraceae bacterium]